MTLYPAFQTFTESEINTKLTVGASLDRFGASQKQVDYLAALIVRNDESRAIYQDFACNTSGKLPAKKASKMIDKLLSL